MSNAKMPFLSHLEELRRRIIVSVIAIGVGFVVSFQFSERVLAILKRTLGTSFAIQRTYPYLVVLPREEVPNLVFLAPAENFWAHLKLGFLTGLLIALPVVLYQVWKFVAPGLLQREKRVALPFLILSVLFFLGGVAFCYFLVLPFAMNFLLTYKTEGLRPMLSVGSFIDFSVKFLLAFGVIFQLPLAIAVGAAAHVVSAKFLARNRKYAILINFTIAAILTPTPDIFNQTLMAGPLCLLYEVGILAARLIERGRRKAAVAEAATET
jgi:sec-independent protein translocase protein TatC